MKLQNTTAATLPVETPLLVPVIYRTKYIEMNYLYTKQKLLWYT